MKTPDYPGPGQAKENLIIAGILFLFIALAIVLNRNSREIKKETALTYPGQKSEAHQPHMQPEQELVTVPPLDFVPDPGLNKVQKSAKESFHPNLSIARLNIAPTIYQIQSQTGLQIGTKFNSSLRVPPNAFLDKNGNVIYGEVDLAVREFRDIYDIFVSGLPMKYDSAGEYGQLESAGMIEVKASQKGEPVFPNPNNPVFVNLALTNQDAKFNLYFLDQKTNQWVYKSKDNTESTKRDDLRKKLNQVTDSSAVKFYFTKNKYNTRLICRSDMSDQKKFFLSKKRAPVFFDFSFRNIPGQYPELKALGPVTWRYKGADAKEIYAQVFRTEKFNSSRNRSFTGWMEASIIPVDSGGKEFRLELKDNEQIINIPVEPVLTSERMQKTFSVCLNKYFDSYQKRIDSEQKKLAKFQEDSSAYYKQFGRYNKNTLTAQNVVLRTFSIDNFGVWNYDRPFRPAASNQVAASFRDENGKAIILHTGFMVERGVNTVYTINDFTNFRFDPRGNTLFWAVLPGDKLAIVSQEEFARHANEKEGSATFIAKVSESALNNYSNLRSALSLN